MPDATTIAKYWAQRWESGAHKPSDRYRPHLCALLGLPVGTFAEVDNSAQPARYPLTVGQRSVEGEAHTPTGEELIVMAARESAEYSRRHIGTNVHTITLDQLESDAVEMATEFVKASPVPVVLRTRALRDQTFDLLDGRQQPRQTQMLYSVAGRLCGLLAVAASDFFGRYDAAATQCRTAWLCAEMAEDDELRSWVRALQSGVAMWAGRWQEASLLAQRAREHATTRVAAARAAALQARAFGRLNNASGVDRAVAVSDAAGNLSASHHAAGVMGFSEANRLRCAGTAYLWLGDIAKADRLLRDALAAYERDAPEAYVFVA